MGEYKIKLCEQNTCTACAACVNICPRKCITFIPDEEGFLMPFIQRELCIECGKCQQTCPQLNSHYLIHVKHNRAEKPICMACWHKEERVRLQSSSGGVFSALAEYVLAQEGVVFGASYSDGLKVVHTYVESVELLDCLRRSKYVQSEIGFTYQKVKYFLENNRKVLFCGTPCQIDGLYSFLKKDYENLLTSSIICHGVASYFVFNKYLSWIESHLKQKVVSYNFRNKRYGWDDGAISIVRLEKDKQEKILKGKYNSYQYALLKNLCLRKCCHHCTANGIKRSSDFTISDFWGIYKIKDIRPFKEPYKGISMLALNSEKAKFVYKNILNKLLDSYPIRTEDAVCENPNYVYSSQENPSRKLFLHDLNNGLAWSDIQSKYLKMTFYERIVLTTKLIFPPRISFLIKRFVKNK